MSTGSDALYERAVERLPGGNTRSTLFVSPHPPYAVRGSGYEVEDADGHRVIDLHGNYTSLVHGHAHPRLVEVAKAALDEGTAVGLPTGHEVAWAEELVERVDALEQVRFANSGTEAVMMAIRAARAFTGRAGVLRFEGCYHGTADPALPASSPGLTPGAASELVTVPVGDAEALARALDERGEELACVIVDLMPARAGLSAIEPAFVDLLRRETAERRIVLVVDEVITFRLARGGLQQLYGLPPDLVTFGKVIGGGFPVGAFGGRAEVMAVFDPRRERPVPHGGTFTANPVTARAGLAGLQLLDEGAIARINGLGDLLRERLAAAGHEVSGRGSLLQVQGDPERWWRLYRAGVLVAQNGLMAISTPMDEEVVERVAAAFEAAA
jgi:glutamate-1-semialdehyde 2,1-aminomutase